MNKSDDQQQKGPIPPIMQRLIRTWDSIRTLQTWTTLKWTPKAQRKRPGMWKRNRELAYPECLPEQNSRLKCLLAHG